MIFHFTFHQLLKSDYLVDVGFQQVQLVEFPWVDTTLLSSSMFWLLHANSLFKKALFLSSVFTRVSIISYGKCRDLRYFFFGTPPIKQNTKNKFIFLPWANFWKWKIFIVMLPFNSTLSVFFSFLDSTSWLGPSSPLSLSGDQLPHPEPCVSPISTVPILTHYLEPSIPKSTKQLWSLSTKLLPLPGC